MATSASLSDRLLRYSATTSVVAGGLLAGGLMPVVAGGAPEVTLTAASDPYALDLNEDGTPEFMLNIEHGRFGTTSSYYSFGYIGLSSVEPSVHFLGTSVFYTYTYGSSTYSYKLVFPYAMFPDANISASVGNWAQPNSYPPALLTSFTQFVNATSSTYLQAGHWINRPFKRFLGVRFEDDGQTYYGWVELTVTDGVPGPQQVIVHRYNANAGAPIPADVKLASAQAVGGVQGILAGAFAALGGALTWLRRKLNKS